MCVLKQRVLNLEREKIKISLASTSCRWETGGFWQTQVENSQGGCGKWNSGGKKKVSGNKEKNFPL